jgi:hypothetical protein
MQPGSPDWLSTPFHEYTDAFCGVEWDRHPGMSSCAERAFGATTGGPGHPGLRGWPPAPRNTRLYFGNRVLRLSSGPLGAAGSGQFHEISGRKGTSLRRGARCT